MKQNSRHKILSTINILLIALVCGFLSFSSSVFGNDAIDVQPAKTPGLKVVATINGVKQFEDSQIHPDNFIASRRWDESSGTLRITNVIVDIKTGERMELPYLPDILPPEPEKPVYKGGNGDDYRAQLSRLKLSGKYWEYRDRNGDLVHYNSKKNTAGLIYKISRFQKTIEGNPTCSDGSESSYIEQYARYYCYGEKKYIPEENTLQEIEERHYLEIDVKSMKISRDITLPQEDPGEKIYFVSLGCDPQGKIFYYYYVTKEKSYAINLRAVSLTDFEFILQKEIPLSDRKGVERTINISDFRSPDFKKVFFTEYDELVNAKTGSMTNPGPMVFVADLETGEHFSLPGLLTLYAHAMDPEGKTLLVNSHQTGELIKYDLIQKKAVVKITITKNLFEWVLVPETGLLYGFTMNRIEVRNFEDLKLIKTIKYEQVFPGITRMDRLIAAFSVLATQDGSRLAVGILKQSGTYASTDLDGGFYILETGKE